MKDHQQLTQNYSTWGDKLLQHTQVLRDMQIDRKIAPINIQIAPTEVCNSDCPFCSVAGRPVKTSMPFDTVLQILTDFKKLGAKSVEITGGGNPLLYNNNGKNINNVIRAASELGYKIGIITNNHNLKIIEPALYDAINWIRISLIQLDEGKIPEDYDFCGFPEERMGFSYIIYETEGVPDSLSRTKKTYQGTTVETIRRIQQLVELHPKIKFVRIAGNCLIKGNNSAVRDKFRDVIDEIDVNSKFFVKDIGSDDSPFNDGCYVGMVRPYIAASPTGDSYHVYTCSSHVLNHRVYDLNYSLCNVKDIIPAWEKMNDKFKSDGYPYEVNGNGGKNWCSSCKYCYYKFNNKLLHIVANDMPDKDFP